MRGDGNAGIADCRLPIADWGMADLRFTAFQSAIGNWQSAMRKLAKSERYSRLQSVIAISFHIGN
jgi:hypothetical protein